MTQQASPSPSNVQRHRAPALCPSRCCSAPFGAQQAHRMREAFGIVRMESLASPPPTLHTDRRTDHALPIAQASRILTLVPPPTRRGTHSRPPPHQRTDVPPVSRELNAVPLPVLATGCFWRPSTHRTGTSCPAARTSGRSPRRDTGGRRVGEPADLPNTPRPSPEPAFGRNCVVSTPLGSRASRSRHQGLQLRAILVRNRHVECAGLAPAPLLALHEDRLERRVRATPATLRARATPQQRRLDVVVPADDRKARQQREVVREHDRVHVHQAKRRAPSSWRRRTAKGRD